MNCETSNTALLWYAMRDLSRRHSRRPAYKILSEQGYEIYTPMTRRMRTVCGRRESVEEPFMQDLLFVRSSREHLNVAVARVESLQYRYVHGGWCEPMTVPARDMERFIHAVESSRHARFYRNGEITESMCGRSVRIVGGILDGYEGRLLSIRGSKFRRLLVELPNFLTAAVEVQPEYIEFLD